MLAPVNNIRHLKSPPTEVLYVRPTLDELFQLCADFKLIKSVSPEGEDFHIECKGETFFVSAKEAEILARGLLIGYFAMMTGDDLSLASWDE